MANISPTQAGRMGVPKPTPQKLSGFRVYCDESNTDGRKRHPVYGAILVSLDDIREVHSELKDWRRREEMHGELAWTTVAGGLRLKKYKSLVDLLFTLARQRRLLRFKAIILDTHTPEYWAYSKGNSEIGFYKFYYHWLLWHFAKFPVTHDCHLRVIIDERKVKGDPYSKLKYALNNGIRKKFKIDRDVVSKVHPLDSLESDLLQAADVLMGAIGYHCQGYHLVANPKKEKVELAKYIALKFHRRDLTLITHPMKEEMQILRWYWKGQPRQRYRRRPADNPRPFPRE